METLPACDELARCNPTTPGNPPTWAVQREMAPVKRPSVPCAIQYRFSDGVGCHGFLVPPSVWTCLPAGSSNSSCLRTRRTNENKKADVTEYPGVFNHVGLLVNEPPGTAGLLFS